MRAHYVVGVKIFRVVVHSYGTYSVIASRTTNDSGSTATAAFNPLNAELNPIRHLLILLDLTFMGKCIVGISKKMQRYRVYLYLETALHVSGGTSTHH
jgi:hypothetical protein